MAFNLGGFAQGLNSGAQTGMDLRQKALLLREAKQRISAAEQQVAQQAAAQTGWANAQTQGGGDPSEPLQGAPPQQPPAMPGSPPQQMPLPGAQPVPQGAMAQPGVPPGPGGVRPMQLPSMAQQPPPGPPGGSQVPSAATLAPNAAAGGPAPNPNLSGTAAGIPDPRQSAQQTLTNLFKQAKQANPNASPAELTRIVDYGLGQMKGLSPMEDAYTRAYMGVIQAQAHLAGIGEQQQGATDRQGMRDLTQVQTTGMRDNTQETVEGQRANAQKYAADMTYKGRIGAAQLSADASVYRTDHPASASGAGGLMGDLKLRNAVERTQVGKSWALADTAVGEINRLAASPDIEQNAAAQQSLIDAHVRMVTGGKPTRAQYDTILKSMNLSDFADVIFNKALDHPILGPEQISKLVAADNAWAEGARNTAMQDPLIARALSASNGGEEQGAAPSRAPAGDTYRSASSVASAYKSGKLTYDQAEKILQANGWGQ